MFHLVINTVSVTNKYCIITKTNYIISNQDYTASINKEMDYISNGCL